MILWLTAGWEWKEESGEGRKAGPEGRGRNGCFRAQDEEEKPGCHRRSLLERCLDFRVKRLLAKTIREAAEKNPNEPELIAGIEKIAEAMLGRDQEVKDGCAHALVAMKTSTVPTLIAMLDKDCAQGSNHAERSPVASFTPGKRVPCSRPALFRASQRSPCSLPARTAPHAWGCSWGSSPRRRAPCSARRPPSRPR